MATHTDSVDTENDPEFELPGLSEFADLVTNLRSSLAHHEVVEGRELPLLLRYLGAWQSLRLSRTHADLLDDREFGTACRFFLTDIYAPHDFSQRDHDGRRIYDFMNRFLPEATLTPLFLALQVNELTRSLDQLLAEVMRDQLGVSDRFTTAQYEEAYRLCDNYDQRLQQIEMIVEVGKHLMRARHLPFISTTLRLARGPAMRLGWSEMQDFLERGFAAWKSVRRPWLFLATIQQREMAILNRIYGLPDAAPDHNPFLVTDGGAVSIVLEDVAGV